MLMPGFMADMDIGLIVTQKYISAPEMRSTNSVVTVTTGVWGGQAALRDNPGSAELK